MKSLIWISCLLVPLLGCAPRDVERAVMPERFSFSKRTVANHDHQFSSVETLVYNAGKWSWGSTLKGKSGEPMICYFDGTEERCNFGPEEQYERPLATLDYIYAFIQQAQFRGERSVDGRAGWLFVSKAETGELTEVVMDVETGLPLYFAAEVGDIRASTTFFDLNLERNQIQ